MAMKTRTIGSTTAMKTVLKASAATIKTIIGTDIESARPAKVSIKTVRALESTRKQKDKDAAKSNIQRVEFVEVPVGHDSVMFEYTIKILTLGGNLNGCDSVEFKEWYGEQCTTASDILEELGTRYATQIFNGSVGWRNLDECLGDVIVTVNGGISEADTAKLITSALSGNEGRGALLTITMILTDVGEGQEIYPSQQFGSTGSSVADKVSKVLEKDANGNARLTSQKVGNALRTIDDWHGDTKAGRISVEFYGANSFNGMVLRSKKSKQDLFAIIDRAFKKDNELSVAERSFMLACFVRGGLIGESNKES